jgi:branched-chain amino acid transport system permease protein
MGRDWSTLLVLAAIVIGFALVGWTGSPALGRVVIDILIKMVVVIGLSVFIGNSGILSFGHASFAVIGAYGAAWFTLPLATKKIFLPHLPAFVLATHVGLPVGAAIGMALAAVSAGIIGIAIVRLSGIAASIATLAWLAMVNTFLNNADSLTRGTSSLVGLPLVVGVGTATVAALVALAAAFLFKTSHVGLMLQASREDEPAARASGINVRLMRYLAFVLSAAIVALGGVLQGHFLGMLAVGQFYFEFTFITLAMLVMGGMRSLSGAVVGTLAIGIVSQALNQTVSGIEIDAISVHAPPGSAEIGLAAIMLLILVLRPRGIMGGREFTLRVLRRRGSEIDIGQPSRSHL